MKEEYQPTEPEKEIIEVSLAAIDQKDATVEREAAFLSLQPPHFNERTGAIIFDIDPRLIYTDKLQRYAETQGYESKREFHVTIVGLRSGKNITVALKGMPPSERQSRIDQIKALLEDSDWTLSSSPKLWHIAREYTTVNPQTKQEEIEHRETIIQTLALKRLGDFYDRLSAIVGVEIPPQFPHLTLYTKGTDKKTSQAGIGVNTEEDFKRYNPQPIELDEAR